MTQGLNPSMHRRATAAAVIGNAVEWFDFAVYGLLSGVIARLFFPSDDPSTAILIGFATLGITFVARPFGGLVFGLWADRHGRRNVLAVVFGLMAIGTLMIGLLPTYAAIGVAAPILLVISRMIQGFSAGGEFGNATTALIEFAPLHRRGFYGSLQMVSQGFAVLAASLSVVVLTKSLDPADFDSWGWRIPFLAGTLIGPIGLYMRMRVTESPEFLKERELRQGRDTAPVGRLLRDHKTEVAAFIGIFAAVTGPNYINMIYLPSIAARELGVAHGDAALAVTVMALLMIFLIPLAGWLSDQFDRLSLMALGLVSAAVCYGILYAKLVNSPSMAGLMLLYICFAFPYALVVGPASTFVVELLPIRTRATGSSLSYNLAAMLFGGLAPLTVSWIAATTGSDFAPPLYVAAMLGLGMAGIVSLGLKRLVVQGNTQNCLY